MTTIKTIIKKPRIIILIIFLILSLIAIRPSLSHEGVAIRHVAKNSAAALAGIESPDPLAPPMTREVILAINNIPIKTVEDYNRIVSELEPEQTVTIKTNKKTYLLTVKPKYEELNETETNKTTINQTTKINNTTNQTINETTNKTTRKIIGAEDLGITVYERPTSNLRKGLDLEGGTRVLLEPVEKVSDEELDLVIANIKERLNVYGVSDIIVRPAKDFSGNTFISVEIAGVNKDEVRELLARQGKFEAKVGNKTVFFGGNDIAYVCRTADCSGIDPLRGCGQTGTGEYACGFRFSISLTPEAAQRQAEATKDLEVLLDPTGEGYLSQNLSLYLDGQLVDELRISSDLKGKAVTDISITGSGTGRTQQEAAKDALANMKKLQTVLITGSLPVTLRIVKTDSISPVLGKTFLKNVMLIGVLAIIAVALVVFIRYREIKISIPMIVTMLSEVIILLGIAALIGWRLDLAAIAGIIIAVGTGVDDQIVIADETLRGEKTQNLSWTEKMKRAFFIIMAAYFTTVVAMLPLWFAGAGLLKGFALTTILGVSIGVFVTRPAYATVVEELLKE